MKNRIWFKRGGCVWLSIVLALCMAWGNFSGRNPNGKGPVSSKGPDDYFTAPKFAARALSVIDVLDMDDAEQTLIATLQGILVNKSADQIYITDEKGKFGFSEDAYTFYLDQIKTRDHVAVQYFHDPWKLVDKYKGLIKGFNLYKKGNHSINAANTLAGLNDAVAVESGIQERARQHGLVLRQDLRDKDEAWMFRHYWTQLNHHVTFEIKEQIPMFLRDFATSSKGLVFFDGNSPLRSRIMKSLDADGLVMGWGEVQGSEERFILDGSVNGVATIPADGARNLSVLSGLSAPVSLRQTHTPVTGEPGIHYCCFVVSDGDNLQWTLNRGRDPRWWGGSVRGHDCIGWTMPPSLSPLAAPVAAYYYHSAVPDKDNFIIGPSGNGFMFPESYPPEELAMHAARLNHDMAQTDTHIVDVIGRSSFNDQAVWTHYTAQPQVKGIFYYDWTHYYGTPYAGQIRWSNGKPIIPATYKLAEKIKGAAHREDLIRKLNQAERDFHTAKGYSLIIVDAWNNDSVTETIHAITSKLDKSVRVVTPEAFAALITQNVPHN